MNVLSFGEILWDIYPDKKLIGGAPFNFAGHLAKHRENVYMLSCLGTDSLGDEALAELESLGIFSQYVTRLSNKQTGQCLVTLDHNAVPTYDLKNDVAYDYINSDNVNEDFDLLYFGTLALRNKYNIDSLEKLLNRNHFKHVFVDINIRTPYYSYESVDFVLSNATILKISDEELSTVAEILSMDATLTYGEFSAFLKQKYCNLKFIIITLGAEGAFCYDNTNHNAYHCSAEKVDVVSTVGAGDSFSAAFVHQYFKGKDIEFCLEYATKIAGFVVSKYDAVPDYDIV